MAVLVEEDNERTDPMDEREQSIPTEALHSRLKLCVLDSRDLIFMARFKEVITIIPHHVSLIV
jgi:hypothetical protein